MIYRHRGVRRAGWSCTNKILPAAMASVRSTEAPPGHPPRIGRAPRHQRQRRSDCSRALILDVLDLELKPLTKVTPVPRTGR